MLVPFAMSWGCCHTCRVDLSGPKMPRMTEAGPFGIYWGGIIGGAIGCGVAVAGLVGLHLLRQRRKEARKERAPQSERILRPAGYSALRRIDELWDKMELVLLQVIGASFIGGGVLGLLFPVP